MFFPLVFYFVISQWSFSFLLLSVRFSLLYPNVILKPWNLPLTQYFFLQCLSLWHHRYHYYINLTEISLSSYKCSAENPFFLYDIKFKLLSLAFDLPHLWPSMFCHKTVSSLSLVTIMKLGYCHLFPRTNLAPKAFVYVV